MSNTDAYSHSLNVAEIALSVPADIYNTAEVKLAAGGDSVRDLVRTRILEAAAALTTLEAEHNGALYEKAEFWADWFELCDLLAAEIGKLSPDYAGAMRAYLLANTAGAAVPSMGHVQEYFDREADA